MGSFVPVVGLDHGSAGTNFYLVAGRRPPIAWAVFGGLDLSVRTAPVLLHEAIGEIT